MTGRLYAQLAEVALRDAFAAVDPYHTDDDRDGTQPPRALTIEDVEESTRLANIGAELELRATLLGFPGCDDPFESAEEAERRRCETWDRVLP